MLINVKMQTTVGILTFISRTTNLKQEKSFYFVILVSMSSLNVMPQELEVRSLYHLYSLKTKSSRCHYVVMTRSETKLSVAIPAPVSGQSAVNVATATSKCSITFILPYDQDGDVKTKQDNVSNILKVAIVPGNLFVRA